MGTFRVSIEIGGPAGCHYETVEALVDTGATYTTVPRLLLDRLGVVPHVRDTFVLADGRRVDRDIGRAWVRVNGREELTLVVFGEPDSPSLLGAYTLEGLRLAPDPVGRRLIPVPAYLLGIGCRCGMRSERTVQRSRCNVRGARFEVPSNAECGINGWCEVQCTRSLFIADFGLRNAELPTRAYECTGVRKYGPNAECGMATGAESREERGCSRQAGGRRGLLYGNLSWETISLKSSCEPSTKVTVPLISAAEGGLSSYERAVAATKDVVATTFCRDATYSLTSIALGAQGSRVARAGGEGDPAPLPVR